MDVVADAAAIGGGPIAAEYLQAVATPHRHLAHKGEQVVGYAPGVLADAATGVGSHRIEVAQPGDAPARFAGRQIVQQLLHRSFAVAVGVDRLDWGAFWDWHQFRHAVEGGAAAEHQAAAAMGLHCFQ